MKISPFFSGARVLGHRVYVIHASWNTQQFDTVSKGILVTNASIVGMYKFLQETCKPEYIVTYRLNQDVLENFFSYIRGMGVLTNILLHSTSNTGSGENFIRE
jgi:hypothetical protein